MTNVYGKWWLKSLNNNFERERGMCVDDFMAILIAIYINFKCTCTREKEGNKLKL